MNATAADLARLAVKLAAYPKWARVAADGAAAVRTLESLIMSDVAKAIGLLNADNAALKAQVAALTVEPKLDAEDQAAVAAVLAAHPDAPPAQQ